MTRAYCYIGDQGDVPLHMGEPTDIETELGVGHRWLQDGWQSWQDEEWDAWGAAMPGEDHVMRIAQRWSRSRCGRDTCEARGCGPVSGACE